MNISALETAIAFAKFIFFPWQKQPELVEQPKMKSGFWLAIILLLTGLVVTNTFYYQA
ncbi:Na(+) H(+) antiporter subunit D [Richelia intracellularis]|nr:Na(+) H(+) antiporter subunit D [Richelia intracellularis]